MCPNNDTPPYSICNDATTLAIIRWRNAIVKDRRVDEI